MNELERERLINLLTLYKEQTHKNTWLTNRIKELESVINQKNNLISKNYMSYPDQ